MGSNLLLVVVQEHIKRIPHLNYVSGGVVHRKMELTKKEETRMEKFENGTKKFNIADVDGMDIYIPFQKRMERNTSV